MKHGEDKTIDEYRKGGWITEKQFQKLNKQHLMYIGKCNCGCVRIFIINSI